MKAKIAISIALTAALFFVFYGSKKTAMSYDGGAPSGYAGDPAGGNKNCTQCHSGTLATVTDWITSDIPVSGYVPNTTYQITATSTGTNGNKGFSISPQSSTGTFLGTLIAGTGTSLNGSNHYIRSSGSNITTNPKVWTFNWTAPAAGQGPVTFYGAFVLGHGVLTNLCQYTVYETSVGLNDNSETENFSIFPNPVNQELYIDYTLNTNSKIEVNIYSLDGRKIACLIKKEQSSGKYTDSISIKETLSKGAYIAELSIDGVSKFQKVIVE